MPLQRQDLDRVFSIQYERIVNKDNTVRWANRYLQIEPTLIRSTMADMEVIVYEHLDATISIGDGPHQLGRYSADGEALQPAPSRRATRDEHRLPFRPKRSALRARLGSTPADTPLLSEKNRTKTESRYERTRMSRVFVEMCSELRPIRVLQKAAIFTC